MQACFEAKDIGLLQEVVAKMDPKEAEYHIKRCVDSGMLSLHGPFFVILCYVVFCCVMPGLHCTIFDE